MQEKTQTSSPQKMRMARLWASVGEDGTPLLDSELPRTDDDQLKEQILAYMQGGSSILRATTLLPDYLRPLPNRSIPFIFMTDGEWIWSKEHEYYLAQHGVLPEAEFVEKMKSLQFITPDVTKQQEDLALEFLNNSGV